MSWAVALLPVFLVIGWIAGYYTGRHYDPDETLPNPTIDYENTCRQISEKLCDNGTCMRWELCDD